MAMSEWIEVLKVLVPLIVGSGLVPIIRSLGAIKNNHLRHLADDVKSVKGTVERTEGRLNSHLDWHAHNNDSGSPKLPDTKQ